MKFLANENFPITSFIFLKSHSWDIKHIGTNSSGVEDEEVINLSIKEDRVIITFDSDYGELVFRLGYKPRGVIYLRIKNFTPESPGHILLELISKKEIEILNLFTVIDENQIRQRKIE